MKTEIRKLKPNTVFNNLGDGVRMLRALIDWRRFYFEPNSEMEKRICAEIERVRGSEHAYFECEVDPATNAVVWRLDLYGKARGYQRLAFATYAEAVAELEKFKRETEEG